MMAQVTVNVCYRTKLFKVSCCPQETISDIVHKMNADSLTDIVLLVPLMFLWGGISPQQFELVPFYCTVDTLLLQVNLSHVLVLLSSKDPYSNQFILFGNKTETLSTYTEKEKNYDLKSNSDTIIILSDSEDVITSDTVTCCGIKLSHSDLNSLYPLHWLNDQVINAYMNLLMLSYKDVHIVSTFFYTKLAQTGSQGVTKWLKNVNVFSLSKLLIPVHLPAHWSLAVIDIKYQKVEYYDSLGIHNTKCLKKLQLLIFKLAHKMKRRLKPHWKITHAKNIPKQDNTSDCGVFICQYARWLCNSDPVTSWTNSDLFSLKDMVKLRYHMIKEITQNQLLPL